MIIFQLTVVGVTGKPGQDVQLIAEEGPGKGPEPAPTQPLLMSELTVREKSLNLKLVTKKIVQVKIKLINMTLDWQQGSCVF